MILGWLKETLGELFPGRTRKSRKRKARKKRSLRKKRGKSAGTRSPRRTPQKKRAPQRQKVKRVNPQAQARPAVIRTSAPPSFERARYRAPVQRIEGTRIGVVSHYFNKIQVAVLKAEAGLKKGDRIEIRRKGALVGRESAGSMQINHIPIEEARAGEEIGIKLSTGVSPGDELYRV
jgi:hypothetical protein